MQTGHTPEAEPTFDDQEVNAEGAEEQEANIEMEASDLEVDTEQLNKARAAAEEIDKKLKEVGDKMTPEDADYLVEKVADFVIAIRESKLFWVVAKMWQLTPNFMKKAGLGKGVLGMMINSIPIQGKMMTEFTRGMVETGILDSPEGVDPGEFTKNLVTTVKILKFAIPIIGIFQPEVLALEPFMPALEKLATGKDGLLKQVRERVAERTAPVETHMEDTHEEVAYTDPDIPHDGFAKAA